MSRILIILLATLLVSPGLFAADLTDAHEHSSCSYCGMDRVKFAHSRMLIEYSDGSVVGTCSLRCAAVELSLSIDKIPEQIRVGDFDSKELIDAEQAFWVVGGSKPGVMTARAKWAFKSEAAAKGFSAANGGELVGFDGAIKAAYEDLYKDTQMIRNKRKAKKMKMQSQGS